MRKKKESTAQGVKQCFKAVNITQPHPHNFISYLIYSNMYTVFKDLQLLIFFNFNSLFFNLNFVFSLSKIHKTLKNSETLNTILEAYVCYFMFGLKAYIPNYRQVLQRIFNYIPSFKKCLLITERKQ